MKNIATFVDVMVGLPNQRRVNMGWSSGSELAQSVWDWMMPVMSHDSDVLSNELALELLELFRDYDCDTMDECDFVQEYLEYNEDTNEWKIR